MTRNSNGGEHWTKMIRQNMETPAWRALSTTAQAIYPWLKLEWKGPKANNNGKISMSVRQMGECVGCDKKTAGRAFHELQRKGYAVVKRTACLGIAGEARSHLIELTEIACPPNDRPRALFREWRPDAEFPVAEVRTNNPSGVNGKQNPVPKMGTSRPQKRDEQKTDVPKMGTARPQNWDEQAEILEPFVPKTGTPLSTRGSGETTQQATTNEVLK
ncbi:hypothetical protein [Tropicimonas marinistellae]|uniref:hypothetical protein n=1 Tax=Tropicimonas marinistellae TaxID=1739787 RepID=UPI0019199A62|nr:hypothetical protein [Tropicimonas marinistellae]